MVGYGVVRDGGEPWHVEGHVHPDEFGRGIGRVMFRLYERAGITPSLGWVAYEKKLGR